MPQSSCATSQVSLGPGQPIYPLSPALVEGCPQTANKEINYPVEVSYDYASLDKSIFDQAAQPGIDRWQALLPPLLNGLSMGEGGTPLTLLPGDIANKDVGGKIHFKNESLNPTFSHKDRLNVCTISAAKASGAEGVVVASSGNHGVSAAAYAARAGLKCLLITAPEISDSFREMLQSYGALCVATSIDNRWPMMREVVAKVGYHPVSNLTDSHTGHAWGPEGYKTISYELYAQLGKRAPSVVVVPTGYGEQLYGIHKGFCELKLLGLIDKLPKIISVEPEERGPLHHAFTNDKLFSEVTAGPTRQLSIACTVGGYRGIKVLKESGGSALKADDRAVEQARSKLGKQGFWMEFSGATGVAALSQLSEEDLAGHVVVLGCAPGFKDPAKAHKQLKELQPQFADLKSYIKQEYGASIG
ncbi:threonine synthase [Kiloniella litopenaei]|uniref:threonine synthase n=1 Tax=Kiloniella litopenaei TaxID=1549748 RepID=UPI003BAA44F0